MKKRKTGNARNDEINVQTDALTDLPVATEQADAIKGSTKGSTGDIYLMQDLTNASQPSR